MEEYVLKKPSVNWNKEIKEKISNKGHSQVTGSDSVALQSSHPTSRWWLFTHRCKQRPSQENANFRGRGLPTEGQRCVHCSSEDAKD